MMVEYAERTADDILEVRGPRRHTMHRKAQACQHLDLEEHECKLSCFSCRLNFDPPVWNL